MQRMSKLNDVPWLQDDAGEGFFARDFLSFAAGAGAAAPRSPVRFMSPRKKFLSNLWSGSAGDASPAVAASPLA